MAGARRRDAPTGWSVGVQISPVLDPFGYRTPRSDVDYVHHPATPERLMSSFRSTTSGTATRAEATVGAAGAATQRHFRPPAGQAQGGIGWHCVAPADTITFRVVASERPINPGNEKRPQQDSNLRSRLRRALIVTPVTCENDPAARAMGCEGGAAGGRGGPLRPEANDRCGRPVLRHV